jgi:HlyD family secretion protein
MLFSAQKIASVDSAVGGTELEVVAFVAARTGKRVLPGQVVRMAVMGLEPTEFGYLEGEVTEVKPYPVSPDFVERTLAEAALGEASYEVHVRPVKDGSRYRWISGPGADDKVSSNTRVDVSIEVSRQRPYTLVIPWNEDDRRSVAERSASVTPKGSSN